MLGQDMSFHSTLPRKKTITKTQNAITSEAALRRSFLILNADKMVNPSDHNPRSGYESFLHPHRLSKPQPNLKHSDSLSEMLQVGRSGPGQGLSVDPGMIQKYFCWSLLNLFLVSIYIIKFSCMLFSLQKLLIEECRFTWRAPVAVICMSENYLPSMHFYILPLS